MRDIRQDLRERLEHLEKELEEASARIDVLQGRRNHLQTLLDAENDEWDPLSVQRPSFRRLRRKAQSDSDEPDEPPINGSSVLASILRSVLADGEDHHLDHMVEAARNRGFPFGDKSPGRVVHFALVGMKKGGQTQQLGGSFWRGSPD